LIYLLDTNTCIRYLNGQSAAVKARLEQLNRQDVNLCSIVKAELLYGAQKSRIRERMIAGLIHFFVGFVSLPFDDRAAEVYGTIRADLERQGTPIGPNDLLIAAIALANGAILVTHNSREFSRVAGLKTEDWE
jgi:tRNA(fMet)-specific endonuclease VapC